MDKTGKKPSIKSTVSRRDVIEAQIRQWIEITIKSFPWYQIAFRKAKISLTPQQQSDCPVKPDNSDKSFAISVNLRKLVTVSYGLFFYTIESNQLPTNNRAKKMGNATDMLRFPLKQ